MSLTILSYIGDAINQLNPGVFDSFNVNAIQLADGRVIRLDDNIEKEYVGISDLVGTSFYIRVEPGVNIPSNGRRLGSSQRTNQSVKVCRLIAFSFKGDHTSQQLVDKLSTDLGKIRFQTLAGSRPVITVKRTNSHYIDNYIEECRKQFDSGSSFVCVSVDFDLRYSGAECDTCEEIDNDLLYVLIIDQDENVIARKKPGTTYPVLVFSGIQDSGPPYTNSIVATL